MLFLLFSVKVEVWRCGFVFFFAVVSVEPACAGRVEEDFAEDEEEPERSNCVTQWGENYYKSHISKKIHHFAGFLKE